MYFVIGFLFNFHSRAYWRKLGDSRKERVWETRRL